ncbi:MAG TPA: bifunctional hydroxymethylpyrimidine kinase/phosphomethylpyrimidine kinase [Nitrosopumilaceae archaeon]|nr:bifunctional hydroxymethylpyrimidine kinase/phosphomethylpyrimidine kinase [Nitrosopumilaceae archaeon]
MHILSIAGSDPSSGAGIQGDLKTFSALGAYGLTVITTITSQNTVRFQSVEKISPAMIKNQIESVLSDFKIDFIKIGMVYSSPIIKAIYSKLRKLKIPIVLDPVFESTTGGVLLLNDALDDFKKLLLPLAFVITPNIPEAEKLAGMKIRTESDVRRAAYKIRDMGARNVIIKGGHLKGKLVTDFVLEKSKFYSFSGKRIHRTSHGGGCGFSASLAVSLAKGNSLRESVRFAKEFTEKSIKDSEKIGSGISIAKTYRQDKIEKNLADAISDFIYIKDIYKIIPECQTNFVFSKPNPKSLDDILGVSGRIVKADKAVVMAGNLKYGGSKHVASAVLEVARKFSNIRSALNIKYDAPLIRKAIAKKLSVHSYDRSLEPVRTKAREGSSMTWGIRSALKNANRPPDLIFHKGDFGKEPMILIFGKEPRDVLGKLAKIVE